MTCDFTKIIFLKYPGKAIFFIFIHFLPHIFLFSKLKLSFKIDSPVSARCSLTLPLFTSGLGIFY